ncbi:thioesterase family protein [Bacillus dakarensis]|uniref:thioesterase family protein n=1 Tax=Robertmurraya dakarensis TaxID=1926278 RepID=UPI0009824E55|nr:thioesterase family protein [Bacillus dakarensis]
MSSIQNPLLQDYVRHDWIDYNGHMTDHAYALVFSLAVDKLMVDLGIDEAFREEHQYSIYTLETHLCYLQEAHKDEELHVDIQLLDYDSKRMHAFFTMFNADGAPLATSEQMLMGMDMKEGRPSPFPSSIQAAIENLGNSQQDLPKPKQAGRVIGIRK